MAGKGDTEANNQVGLVTFSDTILTEIAPVPLSQSRYDIGDAINQMNAAGATALYDAVARAIQLTDDAAGDPRATRAVVVLSDGRATDGSCLNGIVAMSSRSEVPVSAVLWDRGRRAHRRQRRAHLDRGRRRRGAPDASRQRCAGVLRRLR